MTPDVNVNLVDFHSTKGNEMIIPNEDGSYTILINSRSATNKQLEAYRHALEHIQNGDFQRQDVQQIETVAHNLQQTQIPSQEEELKPVRRRKRRRRNTRKLWKETEERIKFLKEMGVDFFDLYEQHWLDPDKRLY